MLSIMTTAENGVAGIAATLMNSPLNWEMTVRAGQALELTDGLWELVPSVVTTGGRSTTCAPRRSPTLRDLVGG
jgi:hypothetical protein